MADNLDSFRVLHKAALVEEKKYLMGWSGCNGRCTAPGYHTAQDVENGPGDENQVGRQTEVDDAPSNQGTEGHSEIHAGGIIGDTRTSLFPGPGSDEDTEQGAAQKHNHDTGEQPENAKRQTC